MAVTQPDSYIADDSTVINTTTDSGGLVKNCLKIWKK